jgi:CHAT domain-containing protein/uncharacterized protein HemY/uncharacterized glyoxalase superfamily protein PhnB
MLRRPHLKCLLVLCLGFFVGLSGCAKTVTAPQEQNATAIPQKPSVTAKPRKQSGTTKKSPQSGELKRLLEEGRKAHRTADYSKALEKYEEGLRRAEASGNRIMIAQFHSGIGTVCRDLGEYDQALQHLERALAIKREIGNRRGEGWELSHISSVYGNLGQYDRALEYREQALAIKRKTHDRAGEGADLSGVGWIYRQLGQYQKALEYYNLALPIRREVKDRMGEGATLGSIGDVYYLLGQYERALQVLEQSLAIRRETRDRRGEANDLTGIGIVYRWLDLSDKALEYHQQALSIRREIRDRRGEAATLNSIANVYRNVRQNDKALQYLEPALAIQKDIKNRQGEGDALSSMGLAYLGLGQNQKALQYFDQSLAIRREIKDQRGEGIDLTYIGFGYRNLGRQDQAHRALSQGLKICLEVGGPEHIWRAQRGLGSVEARLGRYDEAITHYEQALEAIESIRGALSEEQAKTAFMQNKLQVYDELIVLLQTLHGKNPSKGYDRKSLEIFERKQGRAFLEEMGKSGARNFAGLPEAVRARESELEGRLTQLQSTLGEERSKPAKDRNDVQLRSLEQQLTQAQTAQEVLREEIRVGYPDYYALKYPRPATLSELQEKVLKPGEMILVYGVLEKTTSLWVIAKDQFKLFSIGIGDSEIESKVTTFRKGLQAVLEAIQRRETVENFSGILKSSLQDLQQNGRELYALLVPEAAHQIISQAGTLYVVPTGHLYALPFEALLAPGKSGAKELTYLVEMHSIAYLSSASLLKVLREAKSRKKETAQHPLLAFANPVYEGMKPSLPKGIPLRASDPNATASPESSSAVMDMRARSYMQLLGGGFPELPDTEDEAKEIRAILAAPEQSQPLQLREAASRSNVFRFNKENRLDDYRYLVFACHGVLPGEIDPVTQPALVLSHPDPKTQMDGFLTMADVFGLQLNADLVTLSACNTGRGQAQKGEGVIGLTRAFMYAGTPAISVTLWSVESKSAKVLSTGFFNNLKAGQSRAESLRASKLRMIRSEAGEYNHHPFFWAPVVIFGDGS